MLTINESAHKHGLSDSELAKLWESWLEQSWIENDQPGRLLRLCVDDAGRPWEVIAVVFDDEHTMIIHAMRLRKATAELLRRSR